MTEEQMEEKAKKYAQDKPNMLQAYLGYLTGAKMMNDAQARFDELNPYQKADFMAKNIEWAGCKTLQDEIDARENYEKSLTKHFEDEDEQIED